MKKSILLLVAICVMWSCKTQSPATQNIENIEFYSFTGDKMELSSIKKDWTAMINEPSTRNNRSIGTLEIREFKDKVSGDSFYALVALNSREQVQTAALINKYKDGYQISNRSTSCYDCGVDLQIQLTEGEWYCVDQGNPDNPCTKTSRAYTE